MILGKKEIDNNFIKGIDLLSQDDKQNIQDLITLIDLFLVPEIKVNVERWGVKKSYVLSKRELEIFFMKYIIIQSCTLIESYFDRLITREGFLSGKKRKNLIEKTPLMEKVRRCFKLHCNFKANIYEEPFRSFNRLIRIRNKFAHGQNKAAFDKMSQYELAKYDAGFRIYRNLLYYFIVRSKKHYESQWDKSLNSLKKKVKNLSEKERLEVRKYYRKVNNLDKTVKQALEEMERLAGSKIFGDIQEL